MGRHVYRRSDPNWSVLIGRHPQGCKGWFERSRKEEEDSSFLDLESDHSRLVPKPLSTLDPKRSLILDRSLPSPTLPRFLAQEDCQIDGGRVG